LLKKQLEDNAKELKRLVAKVDNETLGKHMLLVDEEGEISVSNLTFKEMLGMWGRLLNTMEVLTEEQSIATAKVARADNDGRLDTPRLAKRLYNLTIDTKRRYYAKDIMPRFGLKYHVQAYRIFEYIQKNSKEFPRIQSLKLRGRWCVHPIGAP